MNNWHSKIILFLSILVVRFMRRLQSFNFPSLLTGQFYIHIVKIIGLSSILLHNLHICINTLIYWMRFSILFRPVQPTFFYGRRDCFLFSKSITSSSGSISPWSNTILIGLGNPPFLRVMLFCLHFKWIGLGGKLFVLLIGNLRSTFKRLQTGVHWSICLLQVVILDFQDLNFSQRL